MPDPEGGVLVASGAKVKPGSDRPERVSDDHRGGTEAHEAPAANVKRGASVERRNAFAWREKL